MLEFLEKSHLVPGSHGTVRRNSRHGEMTVEVDGHEIDVDAFATVRMLVTI
jgi:hypothetical protein